jgi:hypothetical protein
MVNLICSHPWIPKDLCHQELERRPFGGGQLAGQLTDVEAAANSWTNMNAMQLCKEKSTTGIGTNGAFRNIEESYQPESVPVCWKR